MSVCKGSPTKHESLLEILTYEASGREAGTGEGFLMAFYLFCAGVIFLKKNSLPIFDS